MIARLGFNRHQLRIPQLSIRKMARGFSVNANIQPVTDRITTSTIFLTCVLQSPLQALKIKQTLTKLDSYSQAINAQYPESTILCVVGFGNDGWKQLFGDKLTHPRDLHKLKALDGAHYAPSTPGDLFFHIRSEEMAVCFEFAAKIAQGFGDSIKIIDEVHSFKYHDGRNVLGFVDGTGNPESAEEITDATVITGADDAKFVGGSYVITQKYLHDIDAWRKLPVSQQEQIIGRTKEKDIEFEDDEKKSWAHNKLTEIIDENGTQHDIFRDNMPFGNVSNGEFGTFFIGYAKRPQVTEKMLENMFIGDPVGNYDRLLDYSKAVTGNLFFCPTKTFLDTADKF